MGDALTRNFIDIRTTASDIHSIEAAILGCLAVHVALADRERWTVSHLPSGRVVATGFPDEESATKAMTEFVTLRDWRTIAKDDLPTLSVLIKGIARRYRGRAGSGKDSEPLTLPDFNKGVLGGPA